VTGLAYLDGIEHAYGDRTGLRDVSLAIDRGELVGLLGPNGAGKSTLLRILLGMLAPCAGNASLGGRLVKTMPRSEVARHAAFVGQASEPLGFDLDVREVVAMGRYPWRSRFAPESAIDRNAIDDAMQATDVVDLADRPIDALSGGERQRVLLARALAQGTPLLVLDEPSASLDARHAVDQLPLVRARARSVSGAVASLRDLGLASRFCDRVVVLHEGRVVASGAPGEVLDERLLANVYGVEARVFDDDGVRVIAVRGSRGPDLV
jgi:iron complex transport system ATP-binding protein